MSVAADKQFPDADARVKSAEEPLRGITPPAFTRSGSEACLALARTHSGLWPDVEEDRRRIYVPRRRRILPFKSPSGRSIGSSIKFTLRKTPSRQR
ncbi:unnamed protein product [Lasius platythorax]|uniref:Uncharacterized protein n=1 Tax=Lasius platythorax TaxID=488582 RepID=A0AAV2NBM3_9HYME